MVAYSGNHNKYINKVWRKNAYIRHVKADGTLCFKGLIKFASSCVELIELESKVVMFQQLIGTHYHQGMAGLQDADSGNGLQMWRTCANILKKQPQTANEGCLPALRLGARLTCCSHRPYYML
jgi:hypothetical protein